MNLKSERGSALLQVIILGSLLAVMTPVVFQLIGDSQKRQQQRQQRVETLAFIDAVRHQIEDPHLCPLLIGGVVVPPVAGAETPIAVQTGYGLTPGPAVAGWRLRDGGPEIGRLFLRTVVPDLSVVRLDKPGPLLSKHWVRIYIEPKDHGWNLTDLPDPGNSIINATKPRFKEYAIDLHAKVDPATNRIAQCHGTNSIANACEMSGGGYDGLHTNPRRRCNPDQRCFFQPPTIVSSPADCIEPFTKVEQLSGPPGPTTYLCSWCWDGVTNP